MRSFLEWATMQEGKYQPDPPRIKQVQNKRCMFCGDKLGPAGEISPWYGGCHATCLNVYNRKKHKN